MWWLVSERSMPQRVCLIWAYTLRKSASNLTPDQIEKLVVEIKRILQQAMDLGGSTLRDYSNAMGENGYFQQTLLAYGRAGEMCVNCETQT